MSRKLFAHGYGLRGTTNKRHHLTIAVDQECLEEEDDHASGRSDALATTGRP
jgi:hypothetical protein